MSCRAAMEVRSLVAEANQGALLGVSAGAGERSGEREATPQAKLYGWEVGVEMLVARRMTPGMDGVVEAEAERVRAVRRVSNVFRVFTMVSVPICCNEMIVFVRRRS